MCHLFMQYSPTASLNAPCASKEELELEGLRSPSSQTGRPGASAVSICLPSKGKPSCHSQQPRPRAGQGAENLVTAAPLLLGGQAGRWGRPPCLPHVCLPNAPPVPPWDPAQLLHGALGPAILAPQHRLTVQSRVCVSWILKSKQQSTDWYSETGISLKTFCIA